MTKKRETIILLILLLGLVYLSIFGKPEPVTNEMQIETPPIVETTTEDGFTPLKQKDKLHGHNHQKTSSMLP